MLDQVKKVVLVLSGKGGVGKVDIALFGNFGNFLLLKFASKLKFERFELQEKAPSPCS